jgi:hypothetical protein
MLLYEEARYTSNLHIEITFCEAEKVCKLLNYTLPNSAVPYCEQRYDINVCLFG